MRSGFGGSANGPCKHPQNQRRTLHGFGQRPEDVKQFFCTGCQQHVDIVDEGAQAREQASRLEHSDQLPDKR